MLLYLQAPLVAVFVNSASMADPAFGAACADYNAVVIRAGLEPMRLLYLDCPWRDGPGAARCLPSIARPHAAAELDFVHDAGERPALLDTVEAVDAWVQLFDGEAAVELGLDIEYCAAQRRGDSPGPVATLQLVSVPRPGSTAAQLRGAVISLTKLGVMPASLIGLLGRAQLGGVGIGRDIDLLVRDRLPSPANPAHRPPNVTELSSLAVDVLRLRANQLSSLEKVAERCCPGRTLNKRLVDVRRFNWEQWPLELDGMRYAINDAYAGALAMRRLLHPDRRAPPPQAQPPQPAVPAASPAPADDVASAQLLDSMDGVLHAELFGDPADTDGEADDASGDPDDEPPPVDYAVHTTVLKRAEELISCWDASGETAPLMLPTFLTLDDRAALHSFCEHRGLAHRTVGDEGARQFIVSRRPGGAGPNADAGEVGVGGDMMAALPFDDGWGTVLCKYDPRHWMGNWFLMSQSKSSTLFKYFCVATSDAIFQVWGGDASTPGSREHVKAHLRKRFKLGDGVDMSDAAAAAAERKRVDGLIARVRRGYWRSRCRFSIPAPRELARRLLSVYYFFREMTDPETGNPFFSPGHEKRCANELAYVARGELSDHPTIPLYLELRRLSSGLVISRCLRTSSGLEGYHQHFYHALSKCALGAGLRWTEAVTNEFDWRWTVRAAREAGLIPSSVRHYNLALLEYLHDVAIKLLGAEAGARVVGGWRRTRLMEAPLVRHGMYYGHEAQKRAALAGEPAPLQGEGGWVAQRLGSPQPLRQRPTAADVDAVLREPADATGQQLSNTAFARGLHMSPPRAERFVTAVTQDEAARRALAEAGYLELQQTLRTRVPPPAVAEAPRPQLGPPADGGDALPGPQPGMALMEVEEAVLEAAEGAGDFDGGDDDGDVGGGGGGGGGGDREETRKKHAHSQKPRNSEGVKMTDDEYREDRKRRDREAKREKRKRAREAQQAGSLGVIARAAAQAVRAVGL